MSYSTISFGDKLTKNKTCTITYSGMLFQNNSEFVNIVYGFGNEWHHTKEQEMEKTENGFVVEVNMLNYDTFNFCFRNSNYQWDNNNNQNYTSPITEEIPEEINFILNDDSIITNIIDNLCEIDVSTADDTVIQTIEAPTHFENIVDNIENSKPIDFSENVETFKTEETIESQENVQNIVIEDPSEVETNIEIEPIVTEESAPFEIEVETNTPVNIEDSLVNTTDAEALAQDIEKLFDDIYQKTTSENNQENTVEENANFNMNSLIDEILSPVVKSTIFEEETNINTNSSEENIHSNPFEELDDLEEDSTLDSKIDSLITDLFNNTKAFAESRKNIRENINEDEIAKAIDEKIEEILAETPVITEKIMPVEEIREDLVEDILEQQPIQEVVIEVPKKKVPDFTVINEDDEESLIETINDKESNNQTALIEVDNQNDFIVSARGLRKFYMFKKKVKLAFTKLFIALPKLFAKGFDSENN